MPDSSYSHGASPLPMETRSAVPGGGGPRRRRRRLPSPSEQARREAWGLKYGEYMKQLRSEWPDRR